jgi:glycosyltransferase involved in cell wall biosynthesis
MGRLDRQKGLDRLAEVMRQTAGLGLDWRIVGKAVITNDSAALAPEITAALELPLSRPSELAEAYAWADVLILPSRFEGLPLTVLEAMRAGAVVLATDVGATGEVLRNGVNGILVPDDCAVPDCVAALVALAADRTLLRRLSARALSDQEGHDWIEATRELANRLG